MEQLGVGRFPARLNEKLFQPSLDAKYRDQPIGVVVAIGSAALDYVLRSRSELWRDVPVVFSMVDEASAKQMLPSPGVTGSIMKLRFADMIATARAVVPQLKRIALVGDTWESQTIFSHWKDEVPVAAKGVDVIDLIGLPMGELRKHVASLPDNTAILYTPIFSDGAGTFYPPADALELVAETANRPIVIGSETFLGRGGIGGFLMQPGLIGTAAAQTAMRILDGENVSNIPATLGNVVRPLFDWRQMQRWRVSESSLPLGSEIRFRDPAAWDRYRGQIIAVCSAVLLQALLIFWLFHEHRRRHVAEVQSRSFMADLSLLNRRAVAGELSASIAHEVNQPLTGITTRASAARRWLSAEKPEVGKVQAALNDIEAAALRASEIVANVRAMFRKETKSRSQVDINKLIWTVLGLVHIDLQKHQIELKTELNEHLPLVRGNSVELQQVVLNLVMNAIDAMSSAELRVLFVRSELKGRERVHISIEDTGIGIDASKLNTIFKPLFTTKEHGMGMGLSICRSIIEDHGGRIWASAGASRGSVLHVELPKAETGVPD
jgi:signal transduction histidine kinase